MNCIHLTFGKDIVNKIVQTKVKQQHAPGKGGLNGPELQRWEKEECTTELTMACYRSFWQSTVHFCHSRLIQRMKGDVLCTTHFIV